jgi:hypothetical protein
MRRAIMVAVCAALSGCDEFGGSGDAVYLAIGTRSRASLDTLRCAECGGPLRSVKPWRQEDVLGKPVGRRG